jgi:hypothetical protein
MSAPQPGHSASQLAAAFEAAARLRLDEAVYEFFRGGAGDEIALREACGAWASFRVLPHVLRDVSSIDTSVEVLGSRLPSPIGIAPMAYQGLLDAEAEVATVRAAAAHLSVVPTRSTRLLEDVAAAASGPSWSRSTSPPIGACPMRWSPEHARPTPVHWCSPVTRRIWAGGRVPVGRTSSGRRPPWSTSPSTSRRVRMERAQRSRTRASPSPTSSLSPT